MVSPVVAPLMEFEAAGACVRFGTVDVVDVVRGVVTITAELVLSWWRLD